MAKGSGKTPKNRYIYIGLVLAGISVITLLIVFRGSIFTSAAASGLTDGEEFVVEEIDGTDIITEEPVPVVVKKPAPVVVKKPAPVVVKKPATIIEKTKEVVQKVKEKITGEGPGTEICKCLHNAGINFKDLHFPEFMAPKAVKEKKEVIRIMYKRFGHLTPRKILGVYKCAINELKKADSKLDFMEKTDKGQYVQRALSSLINNQCTLNILRSLPYEDIGLMIDSGLVMLTMVLNDMNNRASNEMAHEADKTFRELNAFDHMIFNNLAQTGNGRIHHDPTPYESIEDYAQH